MLKIYLLLPWTGESVTDFKVLLLRISPICGLVGHVISRSEICATPRHTSRGQAGPVAVQPLHGVHAAGGLAQGWEGGDAAVQGSQGRFCSGAAARTVPAAAT